MKRIGVYMLGVLIITILIPTVIVKTFNFVPKENVASGESFETEKGAIPQIIASKKPVARTELAEKIRIFNPYNDKVEEMDLELYVKGVVAAEMPAEFHIEALKSQAVAARTYAVSRSQRYPDGHPDHKGAPICRGIHCQAYLSLDELREIHGESWVEKYWGKIEEAVDSTRGMLIYYNDLVAEPLYHSTSGGLTEDAVNVFANDTPYLKSVSSPYEEGSPKFKTLTTLTDVDFVNKINEKYPKAKINVENFFDKIKLIEKTDSGRIKKIAIGNEIIDGRDIRELFGLNSTNFTIAYDQQLKIIDITTFGYGHGVGMSQWGANGMAKNGSSYLEILNHYYTDVEIKK
ncbi:stage II sporulation protein D [Tissierella creatinini]|nr:stage II sporulation protein D [Tissierella creatinini]TJX60107.1 stage II sporulation protein D [Soehngenia saccharolytica]